jgi:hypothetical protein
MADKSAGDTTIRPELFSAELRAGFRSLRT